MSETLSIVEGFQKAWTLRMQQKNEEAFGLLASLSADWEGLRPETFKNAFEQSELVTEFALLKASLSRAFNKTAECWRWLEAIEKVFWDRARKPPARFYFEKAITWFAESQYTPALELFLLCGKMTSDPELKLCAFTNALLCEDHLGIPSKKLLEEVKTLLSSHPHLDRVREQVSCLELKRCFRNGQFDKILERKTTISELTQSDFLRTWVRSLPFLKEVSPEESIDEFRYQGELFLKSYRQRTLDGILFAEDANPRKMGEWSDRLYLWTWRWLVDPEQFPIERIFFCLSLMKDSHLLSLLSVEDGEMVRNSLLWLSLFDRMAKDRLDGLLDSLPRLPKGQGDWFEFERMNIEKLRAVFSGDALLAKDMTTLIQKHSLYTTTSLRASDLETLIHDLSAFFPEQTPRNHRFEIEVRTGKVIDRETGKQTLHDPMARALAAFRDQESLTFEDLAAAAFGITCYDSSHHDRKVHDLLALVRHWFHPALEIRSKRRFAFAEGNWDLIRFTETPPRTRALQASLVWRGLVYGENPKPAEKSKKKQNALGEKLYSHKELEMAFGRSRSTLNRQLKEWKKQGLVKKKGRARATVYGLSDDVFKFLKGAEL